MNYRIQVLNRDYVLQMVIIGLTYLIPDRRCIRGPSNKDACKSSTNGICRRGVAVCPWTEKGRLAKSKLRDRSAPVGPPSKHTASVHQWTTSIYRFGSLHWQAHDGGDQAQGTAQLGLVNSWRINIL